MSDGPYQTPATRFPASNLSLRLCLADLRSRGYNIGTRLIEDFLARTGLQRCSTFAETAEVVSKVGHRGVALPQDLELIASQVAFKTFLNITPTVSFPPPSAPQQTASGQTLPHPSDFVLTFEENPLSEFAELPRDAKEGGLWFSNVLCGVIRGSLEMVSNGFVGGPRGEV